MVAWVLGSEWRNRRPSSRRGRGRRMRIGRHGVRVMFSAVAVALVAAGLSMPVPSTAAPAAQRPCAGSSATAESVDVDGAEPAAIRHPLCLRVRGKSVTGAPLVTTTTPSGYDPRTIKSILDLKGSGAGQTIAIVVAYDHPAIAADLATFDRTFGLPAPPSFKKVTQTGATKGYPAVNPQWALETALDVEWAHAIAPGAGILLVEARSASFSDMGAAVAYAAK